MKIQKRRNARGFTLFEIMIVIVILGLLGAMVLPNVMGNLDRANVQKAISDVQALEKALITYKADNFNFPTTEQGLEALVEPTDIEPTPRRFLEGGYISSLPLDPWGNDYILISPGEFGRYDVFSAGEDGEPGTDDDIGNWNIKQWQEGGPNAGN
ncbi:type II secretion system major pseudopilin GspG [Thalassotalea maritima]|uniref:type II secretion system major pseudopilin GspG n=1 Tax=Thalassotalea maritima TaxID=3242416 RepID=UPI00352986B4